MSQIKDFYITRLSIADTCKYHTDTLADIDKATPEALCIDAFVSAYRQAVADLMAVVNPEFAPCLSRTTTLVVPGLFFFLRTNMAQG